MTARNSASLVVAMLGLLLAADCLGQSPLTNIRAARKEALERPRRILFDNDGNDAMFAKEPTAEALLELRTAGLEGSHVDTIIYGVNAGFGTTSRGSKVWSEWRVRAEPHTGNQVGPLLDAGIDPMAVMVEWGHKHGMEVFHGVRMNDVHDAGTLPYNYVRFEHNPFKQEHPEWLLGKYHEKLKHGGWSGVNYAEQGVRDSLVEFTQEACDKYDIDGLHFDFFRHPVFFKSTTKGKKATEEELAAMTEMMARIRQLADARGKERGRPILVSIRVPDSVEYARAIGLDIESWLADDLCDMLSTTSYFKLNQWKYSADLGHKYGVKVYPSLDESRVRDPEAGAGRRSDLGYRARAANVWQGGADGMLLFNSFDPASPLWRELGDPKQLASMDKDYYGSFRGAANANKGNLPYDDYQHVETLNPAIPKRIAPGKAATATLMIGDESSSDEPRPKLTLRARVAKGVAPESVRLEINGERLDDLERDGEWLEVQLDPQSVSPGENKVTLALDEGAKKPIDWIDLVLNVRHP